MPTIHERVAQARQRLRDSGIPGGESDLDARVLAEFVLGWSTARFLASASESAPADFTARYEALVTRRVGREPVAYITGRQEFWGLSYEVSPAVLIPRPETESIVEAALEIFTDPDASLDIADVCTGSGCLAVALARERPNARLSATDVSGDALEVARRNARRHGTAARMEFHRLDLLSGIERSFDLIVSNPPYVPEQDRATLEPEVRDHEPAMALFAGDSGLAVIRRLVVQSVAHLKAAGVLTFEFGFGQAAAVREIVAGTSGLALLELRRDLRGIPRVAVVSRI